MIEKLLSVEKFESFRTPTLVIAWLLPVAMLIIGFVLIPNANSIPHYRERVFGTPMGAMVAYFAVDCLLGVWIWNNRNTSRRKAAIGLYWMVLGSLLGILLLLFQRLLLGL